MLDISTLSGLQHTKQIGVYPLRERAFQGYTSSFTHHRFCAAFTQSFHLCSMTLVAVEIIATCLVMCKTFPKHLSLDTRSLCYSLFWLNWASTAHADRVVWLLFQVLIQNSRRFDQSLQKPVLNFIPCTASSDCLSILGHIVKHSKRNFT